MFRKHGVGVDVLQFSLLRRDVVGESVECKLLGPEDFSHMQEITLHAFQYDPATGKPIQGIEPSESPYLRKILENPEGFGGIAHGLVLEGVLVAYVVYSPAPQSDHTTLRIWSLDILGVDPLVQRQGYGTRLLSWSTEQMRQHADFLFTVGHPAFYPRTGYQPLSHWNCSLLDFPDAPPAACMGILLGAEAPKGAKLKFPHVG
jgi:predicted N-acetyltransferase YhbS